MNTSACCRTCVIALSAQTQAIKHGKLKIIKCQNHQEKVIIRPWPLVRSRSAFNATFSSSKRARPCLPNCTLESYWTHKNLGSSNRNYKLHQKPIQKVVKICTQRTRAVFEGFTCFMTEKAVHFTGIKRVLEESISHHSHSSWNWRVIKRVSTKSHQHRRRERSPGSVKYGPLVARKANLRGGNHQLVSRLQRLSSAPLHCQLTALSAPLPCRTVAIFTARDSRRYGTPAVSQLQSVARRTLIQLDQRIKQLIFRRTTSDACKTIAEEWDEERTNENRKHRKEKPWAWAFYQQKYCDKSKGNSRRKYRNINMFT